MSILATSQYLGCDGQTLFCRRTRRCSHTSPHTVHWADELEIFLTKSIEKEVATDQRTLQSRVSKRRPQQTTQIIVAILENLPDRPDRRSAGLFCRCSDGSSLWFYIETQDHVEADEVVLWKTRFSLRLKRDQRPELHPRFVTFVPVTVITHKSKEDIIQKLESTRVQDQFGSKNVSMNWVIEALKELVSARWMTEESRVKTWVDMFDAVMEPEIVA